MANFLGLGNAWDHTVGNKGLGGWLFGDGVQALVPKDLEGLRGQQIQLLMSLLSPGAFNAGGAGNSFFYGSKLNPIDELLSKSTPEMDAFKTAKPILEGMLTGTGPQFDADIAAANSQGGRFSSANAILRGEALRNLFNARTQTAQTYGALAGAAGSSQFDRLFQAQNQRLQLIAGLLGMSGQATLGLPVENDKGAFGDLLKAGVSLWGMRGGGGGGSARNTPLTPTLMNTPFQFPA